MAGIGIYELVILIPIILAIFLLIAVPVKLYRKSKKKNRT